MVLLGLLAPPSASDPSVLAAASSVCYRSPQLFLPTGGLTADHPLDNAPDYCEICRASPARQGKIYCDAWLSATFFLFCRASGTAARRLAPEAWALLVILFFVPTFSYCVLLFLIPVLWVGARHCVVLYRRQVVVEIGEFLFRSFPVWEAQQYLAEIQRGKAEVRAELRREVVTLGIPLSREMDEVLRGERRLNELPHCDYYAIQQAMEAVVKRHRQREEAYCIEAALPYGTDPVC